MTDSSIFRFHVRIDGKRTTISLDPDLFRALTFKLGSASAAKEWISAKAVDMAKTNKSISRQIQSAISLLLVDLSSHTSPPSIPASPSPRPAAPSRSSFRSDDLPL